MVTPESTPERRKVVAERVLFNYFLGDGPSWPGADSLTVDDFLRGYVTAMQRGRLPDLAELGERHPELESEFRILLEGHTPN